MSVDTLLCVITYWILCGAVNGDLAEGALFFTEGIGEFQVEEQPASRVSPGAEL